MQIRGGQIQCVLQIDGSLSTSTPNSTFSGFYSDQQIHLWNIGQSGPITTALQQVPATWSIAGDGQKIETTATSQGTTIKTQTNIAHWTRKKGTVPSPMQVRLSGNLVLFSSAVASVSLANGIQISQQLIINGQPQTPGTLSGNAPAFFPLPPLKWNSGLLGIRRWVQPKNLKGPFGPMQPNYARMTKQLWLIDILLK